MQMICVERSHRSEDGGHVRYPQQHLDVIADHEDVRHNLESLAIHGVMNAVLVMVHVEVPQLGK